MKFKCLRSEKKGYKHDIISIVVLFGILMMLVSLGPNISRISILKDKNMTALANESQIENQLNFNSTEAKDTNANAKANATDMVYLSDIPYMPGISYTSYSTIQLDKNLSGGLITLNVDGKKKMFMKGILAHANATVAYDLSGYNYDYLTAYLGIDASVGSAGNGVRFEVHTSDDGKTWTLRERVNNNAVFKGDGNAFFLKYPVTNVKYIKFVIQNCGNESNDHSVLADAKLIKDGYEEPSSTVDYIKTVEQYDEIIKSFQSSNLTREQELVVLQRDFVNNATYDLLQNMATFNSSFNETIKWLMTDLDNLKLYIMGGKPDGGYYKSMVELSRLYTNYKDDFLISTSLNNKWDSSLTYGDLYKKMAISLSLTHSGTVRLWMQNSAENQSDSVVRYAIYKFMHKNGRFKATDNVDITPIFESLPVETMRFIMNNLIDDESILWLNDYVQSKIDAAPNSVGSLLTPHPYISYVWPNYGSGVYYDEANKDYFNELFSVPNRENPEERIGLWDLTYTIPGGVDSPEYTLKVTRGTSDYKLYKVWMNFRNKFGTGAVCGGISKSGSNIRATHGIPATVIGQPGHAALLYYSQNANGQGYWGIDNDVSGWTLSEKGERMLLGWGNDRRYATGYTIPYMVMAQEAVNRFADYQRSSELLMLANTYANDSVKYEQYLRESIAALDFNVDAWYKLIELYNNDSTKTEEDYYNLVVELSESFLEYPLPFYQLSSLIKRKLTSNAYEFKYSLLVTDTLTKSKNYQGTDVLQPGVTRVEASYLLGQFDSTLATFSFDGDKANKIVLSSRFDGSGIRWDYSLDGKNTWKEVSFTGEEVHELELSPEEIASITSENDIYIHIVGVNYADENLYKIDILDSAGLPSTLYPNDLEDKLIAAVPTMLWKYNENDDWTYYRDAEPDLSGDRDVIVKAGATGVYLADTNSTTYHFTNNVQPNERKYITISHLSIESVSSEATAQGRRAINIIDGNLNTNWHSAWNGSDRTKEIVIKLDEPKNLTAMDYYPLAGGNGKIEKAKILISMDGENYIEVVETDWTYRNTNDVSVRTIDFEPTKGQYIKIIGTKTQSVSASMSFIAGAMLNFYENTTVKVVASFSFDGNNAGKIVLNDSEYSGDWKYSIDGGNTWINASGNNTQLSTATLNSITSENGIKIKINGDDSIYSINIKEPSLLELSPYVNDLENRLIAIGDSSRLEWKYSDTDNWISYSDEEPVVLGNRTLQVRAKATSTTKASNVLEYEFTEDNQPETAKYIPIKHLSIHAYSTQSVDSSRPFYASNVIDGNPNTLWHTDFRYSVLTQNVKPFVTIKLDSPRYISTLEFIQKKYRSVDPDFIKNARVYISLDGENWILAGSIENCPQDNEMRKITFDESVYGQYVKFEVDTYDIFASAAMINLYEDISQVAPHVNIEYSNTNKTNTSVTATLVSDKEITVTNNNGSKTYTFDDNGTFTFEYVDEAGSVGSINATVTWIDKVAPEGTIIYSTTDVTNQDVEVTLNTNEKVTITNNNGSNTYTFTENGEFRFEFVDEAGNTGSATANVTWINKKAPTGTITYNTTRPTNKNVVATLNVPSGVTVTNNNGSKTYTFTDNGTFTFEFVDEAGNRATATATVNWIDRVAPKASLVYSTKDVTNQDVEVTLITNEETIVVNNNGSTKYLFKNNGEFTFEFKDLAGNTGSITAKVDWINKNAPVGTITYDKTTITNQDVVATLTVQDGVRIINNGGVNTYTFRENGSFTFEFVDEAGNKGTATATVDWIDKVAPTGEITYSTTDITNQNVIATLTTSEQVTITNNNGLNTYTFNENGEFTFEFVDAAGNKGSVVAKVNWINKNAPVGTVSYNITTATNQDVIATLNVSDGVTVTNNGGSKTYTFRENGTFTFEFVDGAGNKGTATATVNWINKEVPTGTITYNISNMTNKDVIATLNVRDGIRVVNNNGSKIYTFKENGSFTFEIVDEVGNKNTITATVNWIDKVAPIGTITYDVKESTEGNVIATLETSEEVTILNNNGNNKYTFTHNGEFTFEFIDKAGNKGLAIAKVDWIVNPNLFGKLVYSESSATNKDVIVTLQVNDGIRIINNGGKNTYVFTENGEFDFEIADAYGNTKIVHAKVDWIDKVAPVGSIRYSLTTTTNGEVIATLETNEEVTVTNNNGSYTYVFTENGSFVFEFVDKAGNKGTVEAKVSWIDKSSPIGKITYNVKDLTNKDVTATLSVENGVVITNNGGKNTYVFTENGTFVFEFIDEAGNKGSAVAIVDWIDKVAPVGEIIYSITNPTYENIIATLKTNEEVIILNNNGKNTYVFTKNGKFVFEFVDKAGNKGTAEAIVSWITEEPEEPKPVDPVDPKPEEPKPEEPDQKPSEPSKPVNPVNPQPSKPSKPSTGGSGSVDNNTTVGSGNNTEDKTTTTTTNKVDEKTTTTKSDKEEIKLPEEEDEESFESTGINYKIVLTCLIVFLIFVSILVKMYVRK